MKINKPFTAYWFGPKTNVSLVLRKRACVRNLPLSLSFIFWIISVCRYYTNGNSATLSLSLSHPLSLSHTHTLAHAHNEKESTSETQIMHKYKGTILSLAQSHAQILWLCVQPHSHPHLHPPPRALTHARVEKQSSNTDTHNLNQCDTIKPTQSFSLSFQKHFTCLSLVPCSTHAHAHTHSLSLSLSHYSACEIKATRTRFDSFWSGYVRKRFLPSEKKELDIRFLKFFFQATFFYLATWSFESNDEKLQDFRWSSLLLMERVREREKRVKRPHPHERVCAIVCVCVRERERVRERETERESVFALVCTCAYLWVNVVCSYVYVYLYLYLYQPVYACVSVLVSLCSICEYVCLLMSQPFFSLVSSYAFASVSLSNVWMCACVNVRVWECVCVCVCERERVAKCSGNRSENTKSSFPFSFHFLTKGQLINWKFPLICEKRRIAFSVSYSKVFHQKIFLKNQVILVQLGDS